MAQVDTTWPEATPVAAAAAAPGFAPDLAPEWGEAAAPRAAEGPVADFSRLGLILCFLSAVLTLAGIGSALERIFT
ncbi:MAG TPA: hypothetical protein PK694_00060 [Rhodospirillales bacterium]|jgi:hypothetical protein|nr:hypothetical protein [Rhodospirillales bacterium]